jgi:hypothetical protein
MKRKHASATIVHCVTMEGTAKGSTLHASLILRTHLELLHLSFKRRHTTYLIETAGNDPLLPSNMPRHG